MKIGDRQLHHFLLLNPFGPLVLLTLVAVPIPTTVVAKDQRPTVVALLYPPAQGWSPAGHHRPHHFGLLRANPMFVAVLSPMFPKDIGDGQGGVAAVGDIVAQAIHP
jgi:hypothetical protein